MFGTPKYSLGAVVANADPSYIGQTHFFSDISRYFPATSAVRNGAAWCWARFVINKSGGTLAGGLRVLHNTDATYIPGRAVAGAAGADTHFAGVVCPFIETPTVAIDAGFWLITDGFTKVGYDGSANFAVGDSLSGAASGWFSEAGGTYEDPWVLGAALQAKSSGSAGDLIDAFIKMPFA